MEQRKLILLGGAALLAVFTALGARALLTGGTPAPVAQAVAVVVPKGPKVLVAQRALPVGTIITADAVGFQQWPRDLVRDAYFAEGQVDMNKLIGTVVRYPVTAGQPLTQGALVAPGDRGFLAAALGPGMRAITITVSEKSGVAGFVFPGDHVDLMLTQSVTGTGTDAKPLNVTETILQNLRVLATDQSPDPSTENGKTVVHTFHTVTLEVTPQIAQKIEVAQTVGAISMTLRSIADNQAELDKDIASGKIKVPDGTTDKAALLAGPTTVPLQGPTTFSTGGDVSRFQRHTMPAMDGGPARPRGPIVRVVRGNAVDDASAAPATGNGMGNGAGMGNATGTGLPTPPANASIPVGAN